MRTAKLGSLALGLNNKLQDTQLDTSLPDRSRATWLQAADNVDINSRGYLKRRRGQVIEIAAAKAHSVWGDGDEGFAVVNGALVRLQDGDDGLTSTTLLAQVPDVPMSFVRMPTGAVYYSNGISIGRIVSGALRPIVPPTPNPVPTLTAISGGLPKGRYLVCFTSFNAQDGESAATPVQSIDLPDNSGIGLTGAAGLQAYVSGPNGEHPMAIGPGNIVSLTNHGARCPTINLAAMPPGSIVRGYNGSLLVAAGNTLIISEPYYYGLFNPARGYIPFPAPITVIETTTGGVWICADKTYWLADLFGANPLVERKPYGGIPGTGTSSESEEQAFWQSSRGLMVGDAQGTVTAVQERALKFSKAADGATLYREQDGMTQVIANRGGAEPSVAAATSFMSATVTRKDTVL